MSSPAADQSATLTDAAAEFARAIEMIASNTTQGAVPAHRVIASFIKEPRPASVIRIYSLMSTRAEDLYGFVQTVQDEYIDQDLRDNTLTAIDNIRKAFMPDSFSTDWPNVKGAFLGKANTQPLKYFSRTMRAHRPLRKPTDQELTTAQQTLREATVDIRQRDDLPEWMKIVLNEAIFDLVFAIDNFSLCGHSETINLLLQLNAKIQTISETCEASGLDFKRIEKLAVGLVLLVDLFTAAPNVSQAIPIWQGWVASIKQIPIALLAPPLKRIEGPKQNTTPQETDTDTSRDPSQDV